MREYRFTNLLATLLLLMLASPFVPFFRVEAFPVLAAIAMTALFALVLLSAVFAVAGRGAILKLATIWALVIVIVQSADVVRHHSSLRMAYYTLTAGLLMFALGLLLRYLFQPQKVTRETIAASLCGYLLLGILWADLFSLLGHCDPDSFSLPDTETKIQLEFGTVQSAVSLYFSFVTLTTLGYGDITPNTTEARMFCSVEAITGQLYLAVLVARLVGLYIAQRPADSA